MRDYIYALMTDRKTGFTAAALKSFLFLLSLLYLLAIRIIFILRRQGLLRTAHLDKRVVSIGNLTLGGTGKTPLVELTANLLSGRGKKVCVLTRGYRISSGDKAVARSDALPLFEEIGDEPALLRLKLPQATILVGPDRVKNAVSAVNNYGADVLLLDDGFQSWELSRDTDILTIDATNPFGNERLLPRGILREPVSGAGRADVVVITKTDAAGAELTEAVRARVKAINPRALIFSSVHKPSKVVEFSGRQHSFLPLDWLEGKDFVVVSGIGDPHYFIKTLQDLAVVVKDKIFFEDHHPYGLHDLAGISDKCREVSATKVITTEKDMVRLEPLVEKHAAAFDGLKLQFFALQIQLEILEDQDKFIGRLLSG